MTEARRTTLGALGRIVVGKTPLADPEHFGGPVPFITPADLDGRRVIHHTARTLSARGANPLAAAALPRDAVLIQCIGTDLGKVALAGAPAITNQQIAGLIVDPPHSPRYVYYNLLARRAELRATAGGSAQPILTRAALAAVPIILPAPAEQRAVVELLGLLDDKRELDARLIDTLADLAATRFRAEFVEGDHHTADSHEIRLGDLVHLDKGLTYHGKFLGEDGPPLVGLGDFDGLATPRRYAGPHRPQHRVVAGDLLIANTDLTAHGRLLGAPLRVPDLDHEFAVFSQHAYAVRIDAAGDDWPEFLHGALQQPEFRARAVDFATGTTVLALPRDAVLGHSLRVPPARVRAEFAAFVRPLFARLDHARHESRALVRLRDHWLHGLMSGALALPPPPAIGGPRAVA